MSKLLVEEKAIVVPGEIIAEGMDYLPSYGTRREGENIVASKVGLLNVDGRAIKLIPLSGRYLPKAGDTIIAKVTDVGLSNWMLELNCAYPAMLGLKDATSDFIQKGADLRQYYDIGDYIVTKILKVSTQKLIDLTMKGPGLRKLAAGRIINVAPNKVPRIIGKRGSMVSMIKLASDTQIIVGQNGVIWLLGKDPKGEELAVKTIRKIEAEAHISGLTDIIKGYLEKETGKPVEIQGEEK